MADNQDKKGAQAIALTYQGRGSGAPKVVAKGFNQLAEEIVELARQEGVLVHEDPELADLLARLDVGDEIPPVLYVIIAELIAYNSWLNLKA